MQLMKNQEIVKLLAKFIGIESVSTDPNRYRQILKAVDFLKDELEKIGCSVKLFKKNNSPPLVIGVLSSPFKDRSTKTLGIYGHYDVQPEEPVNEWLTPPFKLTLKKGRFYGRGVADDKGHIIQNLTSIKHLIKVNKLKNNIIFIFEGEEEASSLYFEEYVKKAKKILNQADVFYLTDTGMHQKNQPQIFYGLRGIVYFQLTIKTGERDLHSGVYGNQVYNPAQILVNLLAKIKEPESNKIKINRFYDRCRKIEEKERKLLEKTIKSADDLQKEAQTYQLLKLSDINLSLASKIYPSFEINGLLSGYTKEGEKTIIPKEAMAKFSFRLVEHQSPDEIEKLVRNFVKKNIPQGVKFDLKTLSKSSPFYTDTNNKYLKSTEKILEKQFGNQCLLNRSGGSVPAAEVLQRLFKKPVILTGFTLPDDNIHAPNENFDQEMFWQGIKALEKIYSQ